MVDQRRLRSSDRVRPRSLPRLPRAQTSAAAPLKQELRASGREKLNEWMERAIEAALEAEGKGRREKGYAVEA